MSVYIERKTKFNQFKSSQLYHVYVLEHSAPHGLPHKISSPFKLFNLNHII